MLEKLKKALGNKYIPDSQKEIIRKKIKELEAEEKKEPIKKTPAKKTRAKKNKIDGRGRTKSKARKEAQKDSVMVIAKRIRKDGEKWVDALKRAGVIKKNGGNGGKKVEKVKFIKPKNEKVKFVRKTTQNDITNPKEKGYSEARDKKILAKPVGKRVSKNGKIYYEYRKNRSDVSQKEKFGDGGSVDFNLDGFMKYAYTEIAAFLDAKMNVKLTKDWEFKYDGKTYNIEPLIHYEKGNKDKMLSASFTIYDNSNNRLGEIDFVQKGHKDGSHFSFISKYFGWDNYKFKTGGSVKAYNAMVRTTSKSYWKSINDEPVTKSEAESLVNAYKKSDLPYYKTEVHVDLGFKKGGGIDNDKILLFHIGRGGKFNNSGFLTFDKEGKISDASIFNDLFPMKDKNSETIYVDEVGNDTGLTEEDVEIGIGMIDIDGDYDTTYSKHLSDLNEEELKALAESNEIDLLEEYGFEDIDVLNNFGLIDDMIDANSSDLDLHGIEDVDESKYDEKEETDPESVYMTSKGGQYKYYIKN